MKTYKMMKKIILSLAVMFMFGMVFATEVDTEAAVTTVTETKEYQPSIVSVGDHMNLNSAANLKINGKAPKKIKKKVKAIYAVTDSAAYYIPASYYDREAYNTYADYKNAQNNFKYYAATDYYFCFQKPGTYTFKYYTYSYSAKWNDVEGKDYQSYDIEVKKTLHIKKYKVVKDTNIVKSITLGNAKYKNTRVSTAAGKTTSTNVKNQYLKGNSGKLKIAMNNTYKITSIVVLTYDAEGDPVYTQVKNKGKVTFGQYARDDSYVSTYDAKYNRTNLSLMKETKVYIAYQNKLTGAYTKYTVKTRENGDTYVENEYKYYGNDQVYTGTGLGGNCVVSYTFYKK